jgi:c-di-GMP-binding flagellar brake protein YcgR
MSTESPDERRRFSRIPFHIAANIYSKDAQEYLNVEVIDISLNGLLIVKPDNWSGQIFEKYNVDLLLENALAIIHMQTSVAHVDDNTIGFICEHIDLASISHLKRLVELNLGDEEILQRELSALIH